MSKTKMTLTPDQISNKWNTRMKNAVPDIVQGINNVTESPMEAAAAKQDKMLAGITAAVQNGRWAKGLRSVSLTDWKANTAAKVQSRLAGGVDAAMDKRRKFDTWLVPAVNAALGKIKGMPDMTLEDSVGRVRTYMTAMAANPYKGSK